MRRSTAAIAPGAVLAAFLFAGCGSTATKTVSVSGRAGTANTTGATALTAPPTSTNGTTPGRSASSTPARTAPAPQFAEHTSASGNGGGEGLDQAVEVVKAHGFAPVDTSQYRPGQTLRVLVAARAGSGDGYDQQAFFFVDGRYIGTDASTASGGIEVVAQSDTEATLGYRLYRPGDPLCCARAGRADVRFQLDNGRLVALDPIPPAASGTQASRR